MDFSEPRLLQCTSFAHFHFLSLSLVLLEIQIRLTGTCALSPYTFLLCCLFHAPLPLGCPASFCHSSFVVFLGFCGVPILAPAFVFPGIVLKPVSRRSSVEAFGFLLLVSSCSTLCVCVCVCLFCGFTLLVGLAPGLRRAGPGGLTRPWPSEALGGV